MPEDNSDKFDFQIQKNPRQEIRAKYVLTFLRSDIGREVLADLLHYCQYFGPLTPEDQKESAVRNVAVWILQECGLVTNGEDNTRSLLSAMIKHGA